MKRSHVLVAVILVSLFSVGLALATNPEEPAVCIKVFNDSQTNLIAQIHRESGMDHSGYNTEGSWYIGPGKSTQGIFRGNLQPGQDTRRMYVNVLNGKNEAIRQYLILCSKSNVGTYEVYQRGKCSLVSGSSDDLVTINQEYIHDDNTVVPPANLEMLIISFRVKQNTR